MIRPFDQVDLRNFCVIRRGDSPGVDEQCGMTRGPYVTSQPATYLRIRQMRKKAGLTQAKLAELMDKDTSTINRWERGILDLNVSDLLKLANILNCPPGELIVDGDGLEKRERDLVHFLRANPIHRKILLSQLDVLKETMPPIAAE